MYSAVHQNLLLKTQKRVKTQKNAIMLWSKGIIGKGMIMFNRMFDHTVDCEILSIFRFGMPYRVMPYCCMPYHVTRNCIIPNHIIPNRAITCRAITCRAITCRALTCLVMTCLVMVLFAGCAVVGPNYVPPATRASQKWSTELSCGLTAASPDTQALASWWTTLNDPVLTALITRAVAGNLDLRKAQAHLVEALARRGVTESDRFPTLNANGSATLSRSGGKEHKLFNAGFDASWEIDLFGKIQRSIEASEAELEASRENVRDVLVSLLAEVALNYVDVRSYQTKLDIAAKSLKTQEETYQLTLWRSQAGLTSQLDVEQAKSNLEETRALVPSLQVGLDQAMNQIALLLGKNPGSVREDLSEPAPIPVTPIEIAIGVPADVLRRIPSVREAERLLAAQTAQVGVATADLYPQFNLIGSIGLESVSTRRLSAISQLFSIGPNFSWPVFDAGRLRQNIKVQNALAEQAMITYEEAVLTALKDVENSLVAYAKEQVRRQSLQGASEAAQHAENLASSQYSSGLIDFQSVLDSKRSLLSLQTELADSDANVTSNLIRLYKALGGGWKPLSSTDGLSRSDGSSHAGGLARSDGLSHTGGLVP